MFDPADFDWTTVTTPAVANSYDTVDLRTGATAPAAAMFPVSFQIDEASLKATQKVVGCSNSFDFELSFQLPQLSQELTDFLNQIAAAACCCGLGLVVEMNDGKIFVLGERYVNGDLIPRWIMKMDGTTLDSGKTFTEFNGAILLLKGSYSRAMNEFVGGASAIEALEPAP
jgi:hypothetical protein